MTSPSEVAATGQVTASRRAQVTGLGLIGTSIALALRARGWWVTGRDLDKARQRRAHELGAVDELGVDRLATVAFVATPVAAVAAEVIGLLAGDQSGELVVTDVGGVKGPIVTEISHPRFVGGHPMAGSEQEGPDGADPELFAGATWVLTPTSFTDPAAFSRIQSVIGSFGADLVALAPARHDELVAMVSHVPHLTAATLMGLAAEAADTQAALLRLAAGGFRDMTRVAAGSPAIWPDICRDNAPAIVPVLDALVSRLIEVRRIVATDDRTSLVALLDHAQLARRNLPPRASRPSSVTELHVVIPDRPGVLAQVTTITGELGVNIEDLEMFHSQDRPRGVLILTVATDAADRVRRALAEHGYGISRTAARRPVIAIDGPAGAGKSTVAREVARRLDLERLDTGAMYRAVTLAALEHGIEPDDAERCAELARSMNLSVGERVVVDGRDVTEPIRQPAITEAVSIVAAHPEVRAELVRRQRAWVEANGGGVVEGRDIGSVVLPDADLKVFLTADSSERATRRAAEERAGPGGLAATEESIRRRDELDSTRMTSPLVAPKGAIVVDSTGRSVESVVEEVLSHL
ncbi:MAG TPA: (d)CMP kinase [Acidimicrobiales bacterium]|nr:(d)CMP kinase [Acidimicrobiales bacterium]